MSDLPVESPAASAAHPWWRGLLECAALLLAGLNALFWLFIFGMKCQEGCTNRDSLNAAWYESPDSWQWPVLPIAGALALAGVAAWIVVARKEGAAMVTFGLTLAAVAVPWVIFFSGVFLNGAA